MCNESSINRETCGEVWLILVIVNFCIFPHIIFFFFILLVACKFFKKKKNKTK